MALHRHKHKDHPRKHPYGITIGEAETLKDADGNVQSVRIKNKRRVIKGRCHGWDYHPTKGWRREKKIVSANSVSKFL